MEWIKSSRCDTGNCVEVAKPVPGNTFIRDSKRPDNILVFTDDEWRAFILGAKAGEFDV